MRVVDYRFISLYNMHYKLISKVIANRLKLLLPQLISDSQSTFVLEKQITNIILLVYEIIHFLKKKDKGKQDFMSLKLDMNKTYDKVEWDYLECTLSVMGFPH